MRSARKCFHVMIMVCFILPLLSLHLLAKEGTKKTASAEQKKVESQKENAPLKDQPQISFDTTRYDVGEVREGERISHTFIVKNTGTAQLDINKVKPG